MFYSDALGLKILREWSDGVMIDAGGEIPKVLITG